MNKQEFENKIKELQCENNKIKKTIRGIKECKN